MRYLTALQAPRLNPSLRVADSPAMRVLIAFDKFKDALTASSACAIAAEALHSRHANWSFDLCPLTDGGDGFCEILTRAAGGKFIDAVVTGPRGAPVAAKGGLVPWKSIPPAIHTFLPNLPAGKPVGLVDLASASGLALLAPNERDVWHTSTFGTGELLRLATHHHVGALLLGVGGSATHDLGLGILAAFGFKFLTPAGHSILPPVPARWPEIVRIEGELPRNFPPLFIACDVTHPLLGPRGAGAVFGPQKGLRPADYNRLESESARLAHLLAVHCGRPQPQVEVPGTGAAGGASFGLLTAARAQIVGGAALVSAWLDLERRLAAADVVITGEGRFDASSWEGKITGAVVRHALALGKPTHVFAGQLGSGSPAEEPSPTQHSSAAVNSRHALVLHAITPADTPLADALQAAAENLRTAVKVAFENSSGHP